MGEHKIILVEHVPTKAFAGIDFLLDMSLASYLKKLRSEYKNTLRQNCTGYSRISTTKMLLLDVINNDDN